MAGVYQQQVSEASVRAMQNTYEKAFTEVSSAPEKKPDIFDELSPEHIRDVLFDKSHSPEARLEAAKCLVKRKHFKYKDAEQKDGRIHITTETGGFSIPL